MLRPRLVGLVDDAVGSSALTLLSAPAGAGKSVLMSSWAATGRVPGPLVTVPPGRPAEGTGRLWDEVARQLWAAAGCAGAGPRPGRGLDLEHLGSLTRRAASGGPVVLVVDEVVPRPDLHHELDLYMQQARDCVRVVILTRSDPVLPFHRYRLAGGLAEIRSDDLRFTRAEAAALLLGEGASLTPDQLTTLLARTRGWAAGLSYAAARLSGADDPDATLAGLTGSEPAVSDYLAREVLDVQSPDVRELMLRTSVPDELPIGLFEALSGHPGGRDAMVLLATSNTFIAPVSGNPTTYEYQPLFREFLLSRLEAERPDLLPDLHDVAAHWWAHSGNLHESTLHAAAAGLWSDAAGYLVENLAIGRLLDARLDTVVAPLFEAMPPATSGGPAAIVRAALALRAGDMPLARTSLADGRAQLSSSATSADAFSVELLESALAAAELDTDTGLEALRVAERHLATLLPSEPDLRPELGGQLALLRSGLHLWGGNLYGAKSASLDAAEAVGAGELALAALTQGALLSAILGEASEALLLLDRVDDQVQALASRPAASVIGRACVASAWLLTERAHVRAARRQVALADEHRGALDPVTEILLEVVRARVLHANGDFAGARTTLETARASFADRWAPGWVTDWLELAQAVHAAAEGGPDPENPEAGRISLETTQWHGEPPLEMQISLALDDAAFWLREGDESSAVALLTQALGLAAPQRTRRPFTEAPPTVRQLLRSHDELQTAHPWLSAAGPGARAGGEAPDTRSLPARGRGGRGHGRLPALEERGVARPVVVEPLTAKELEVLGYLNDLATTAEIGAAMFISVNTVRTHVRNLLRKLGAERRNDAVRRAWELGLLDAPRPSAEDDGPEADPELRDGRSA
ncbi:hypothetical protein ASG94_08845 [Nocardioides sp. Soil805]|nr:hypothetical protein ASG94_08845 [Nocardioides sp. Soil805]